MFYWPVENEEIRVQIETLAREAFKLDSVTIIQEVLAIASKSDSEADSELITRKCLQEAVQSRSLLVLEYLLTHGADVRAITTADITVDWGHEIEDDELEEEEGPKYMEPPVELLEILIQHGWDINNTALPQENLSPLLWYVCSSLELVEWCLNHGANVIVPGEVTSTNPKHDAADIFHTPRRPLLLENVAALGNVTIFELLRSQGAPLTPGKSWPPWHSPCLLMRAIQEAARCAPGPHSESSLAYKDRVSVVNHLLDTILIHADEDSPRNVDSRIVNPSFMPIYSNTCKDDLEERDLRELVCLLLNAKARPESLINSPIANPSHHPRTWTPLGYLQQKYPVPFEKAMGSWQQDHAAASECSKIKLEAVSTTKLAWSSPEILPPSSSQLCTLPAEIIDRIAINLVHGDLLSVRSISRAICSGSFAAFRAQLRRRKLSLTFNSIEAFRKQLQQKGHLASYVEELNIHEEGNVDESGEDRLSEANNVVDSDWSQIRVSLTELFRLAKLQGAVNSLTLHNGEHMVSLVFSALKDSGLLLDRLDLFPNAGYLASAIDQYRELSDISKLSSSLNTLRDLSWTIATSNTSVEDTVSSSNIATIKRFLNMTSNLEQLDLCWYRKPPRRAESFFTDSCIDALVAMTRLVKLTLRGISVSESTLEALLTETTAERVTLRHLKLREGGTLRPLLDILTSGRFDYFHLDDLFETRNGAHLLARFDVPGRVKFPVLGGGVGPSEIVREGNEARRKLEYRFASGRPGGSSDTNRYMLLTQRTYGHD